MKISLAIFDAFTTHCRIIALDVLNSRFIPLNDEDINLKKKMR